MNKKSSAENKSLLSSQRYVLFWFSSLFSNIGTWMQQVAQPWVILSVTSSTFYVGLDSFAMNAPGWIFTLVGGALADHFDRKKIILYCQSIQFFTVIFLYLMLITDHLSVWYILLSSFVIGSTDALSMPAFQSIIPSLVEESEIPRAVALNSTQFNLSRILGPAIAGVVIAAYGAATCYAANIISFIPFFLSLYWIYPKAANQKLVSAKFDKASLSFKQFSNLLVEFKYFFPLITIFTSTFLCSPLLTFTPVLVKNVFAGSAAQLGWSMGAFGIGGVLGSLFTSFSNSKLLTKQMFSNFLAAGFGAILMCVSFAKTSVVLIILLVAAGTLMTISATVSNSILQKSVTNTFRGRVVSLFQLALHGGIGLGGLVTGALAQKFEVIPTLFFNGALALSLQVALIYYLYQRQKQIA